MDQEVKDNIIRFIRNVAVISVFLSVLAHVVFFASSNLVHLSGMRAAFDETRKIFRLGDVEERPEEVDLTAEPAKRTEAVKMSYQPGIDETKAMKEMMLEGKVEDRKQLEEKKERMAEEVPTEPEEFDLEKLIDTEEDRLRAEAEPEKRSLAEMLLEEEPAVRPEEGAPSEAPLSRDYASLSGAEGLPSWGAPALPGERYGVPSGDVRVGSYEDIGDYLDVKLYTYIDPATDEKYFKLQISTLEESPLKVIPKEVTFLVDSSKSITAQKLEYIKSGVSNALGRLNPGDRFNVVAFREGLINFRPSPVEGDESTVREAVRFLDGLEVTGQTDVNAALLGIISGDMTMIPSYIVLVSDGRPTTGVTDSRSIIQEITRINRMERPIFCFGGGRRVNRYLLEFISYQNRAWSIFAAASQDIAADFLKLYYQIKDPLLLNVRYRISSTDVREVYPKYLSDFYRGRPFTLYGRFKDEDVEFSMQLLGQIDGTTKEFIFSDSLANAEEGGKEIAEGWAFRKVYYLISRNTMGLGDPGQLRAEINRLSRKYGITTPYDIEDGD